MCSLALELAAPRREAFKRCSDGAAATSCPSRSAQRSGTPRDSPGAARRCTGKQPFRLADRSTDAQTAPLRPLTRAAPSTRAGLPVRAAVSALRTARAVLRLTPPGLVYDRAQAFEAVYT